MLEARHPGLGRRPALGTDVDLAGRILPDQHHGEAGRPSGGLGEGGDGGGYALAQPRREGAAVDALGAHRLNAMLSARP